MRLLLQRCIEASVSIENEIFSEIKNGFVVFVGVHKDDKLEDIDLLVKKLLNLRVLEDNLGKINLSILDKKQEILSVSQYSLYAEYKKGNRPSFMENANIEKAKQYYEIFNQKLSEFLPVKTGIFQADMKVHLINDGPFTMLLDSSDLRRN